jgi:acyl-CoA synthetase (AMP-forming)/AMP-acid ligase II
MPARPVPGTTDAAAWTVAPLLDRVVAAHPERAALVDADSGATVDYAELGRAVERIAAWLHHDGVAPGERLATWAPNAPPVAAVTLAALRLGVAVTGLSPALTAAEAVAQVADAGATVIVTLPVLAEPALRTDARRVVVLGDVSPGAAGGRLVAFTDLLAAAGEAPRPAIDPDSPALLPYSSGTTGLPKGVVLPHRQVVTACHQTVDALGIAEHDVTLALAPWFHILGATAGLLAPLAAGATIVVIPRFDPARLVDLLETHRVTFLAVAPPIAAVLAAAPDITERLAALELLAIGGAPLPLAIHETLQERLPRCAVGQGWGMTETTGALCLPRRPAGTPPGTVGRPVAGTEVRAVDPATGTVLGAGRAGELQVRGPQTMAGYLDRPDETSATFTADGWLRTGDLGHVDAAGDVVISGRLKELIKVNALQVAPAEVEAVLAAHPGVADVAVVGRPDERTGETPVAHVVVADGAALEVDELAEWAAARLARHKRPSSYRVVASIPRNPSGKILRRLLS